METIEGIIDYEDTIEGIIDYEDEVRFVDQWSNGSQYNRTDRIDTYCCSSSTCESKNGKVVCPTGQSKIVNIAQKCDSTNEQEMQLASICHKRSK